MHPKTLLKMITQLEVLRQCYGWQDEGKTEFSIHNIGQAPNRKAIKNWSTHTHASVIIAAMHKTKVQELVKELFGENAEDEQKTTSWRPAKWH